MRRAPRPHADLPDVFRGREAVEQGLLTPAQLRGPLVRRVIHGVYRPSWVPLSHPLASRAVSLVLPDGGCVTGRSAATLLGVPLASSTDPVEVCIAEGQALRHRTGMRVRVARWPSDDVRYLDGIPVAGPLRMAFDLSARVPLPLAVAHLDAVARAGLVDEHRLLDWVRRRTDNDVRQVRAAAALVDRRAESLPESQARVVLELAGFDVTPQLLVVHSGRAIARVDLAIEALRIAIEYDGAWHALREQLSRDRERLNRLSAAGWLVVHLTAPMLRDPVEIVAAVRAAVSRRTAA